MILDTKDIVKLVIEGLMLALAFGGAVFKVINSVRAEFDKVHAALHDKEMKDQALASDITSLRTDFSAYKGDFVEHRQDDKREFGLVHSELGSLNLRVNGLSTRIEGFVLGKSSVLEAEKVGMRDSDAR